VARAQRRIAAGVYELQRLDEELDLADAALAVLDVEAGRPAAVTRGPPGARIELALDAPVELHDLVDDRGPGVARVHERSQRAHDVGAEREIAGAGAGLDPRLPLPRPAEGLVVALDLGQRVGDGAARALGAQAQVAAEHGVVGGDVAERVGHRGRQLGEVLVQRQLAGGPGVRAVDVDDVDVGREVELGAAVLAHGDDHQAGIALDPVVVEVAGRAVPVAQPGVVEADGGVEAGVGEVGELAADLGVEAHGQLARAQPHQLVGAGAAQRPAQLVGRRGAGAGGVDLGGEHLGRLLAAQVRVGRDPHQAARVAGAQGGEVGSVTTGEPEDLDRGGRQGAGIDLRRLQPALRPTPGVARIRCSFSDLANQVGSRHARTIP
jgi:hypothetical protein